MVVAFKMPPIPHASADLAKNPPFTVLWQLEVRTKNENKSTAQVGHRTFSVEQLPPRR